MAHPGLIHLWTYCPFSEDTSLVRYLMPNSKDLDDPGPQGMGGREQKVSSTSLSQNVMYDIFLVPVYTSSPTPALFKHERYNIQRHEGTIVAAPILLPGVGYRRWVKHVRQPGLVYRSPPLLTLPPLLYNSGPHPI